MLTYSFADIGSDCLYIHLYKCIKNDILSGKLPPQAKLPSKRSFAKNLGISTITVENAYAQLQSEGYIYSLPKKGFYVTEIQESGIRCQDSMAKQGQSFFPMQKKQSPPEPTGQGCQINFVSNQTNPNNFPFSIWAKLMRETIAEKKEELMATPPSGGVRDLRLAICSHLKAFRNMDVSAGQIIIGAGTEYLYGLLIQLLGFEKTYAIENPGYRKLSQIYESYRVRFCTVGMDQYGIHMEELEKSGSQIAHITPSHHFPTGIVTPVSRRYELLAWAARAEGRYIIEDDYDSEFRLAGRPIPTLQSIDHSERVIYINTFAKSLSSTVRLSYMVLPQHLLEEFYQRFSFYSCTVSNFEQYTLARFLSGGYFEKHINRMRTHYRSVRDQLLRALKESPFSSRIRIAGEDSGLHFLLYAETDKKDWELLEDARQQGLHIACLSQYYIRPVPEMPEHTLVLNYSGLMPEKVPEAVERLGNILLPKGVPLD